MFQDLSPKRSLLLPLKSHNFYYIIEKHSIRTLYFSFLRMRVLIRRLTFCARPLPATNTTSYSRRSPSCALTSSLHFCTNARNFPHPPPAFSLAPNDFSPTMLHHCAPASLGRLVSCLTLCGSARPKPSDSFLSIQCISLFRHHEGHACSENHSGMPAFCPLNTLAAPCSL